MKHCTKCNGFGFLPQHEGIRNGQYFKCGGVNTRGMTYHTWLKTIANLDEKIVKAKRILKSRETFFKSLEDQPIETEDEQQAYERLLSDYHAKQNDLAEYRLELAELQQT